MDVDKAAESPVTDVEWVDLSGDGGVMKKVRIRGSQTRNASRSWMVLINTAISLMIFLNMLQLTGCPMAFRRRGCMHVDQLTTAMWYNTA